MFDVHQVRKQALLDAIIDFLKELTHDFGQNLKISSLFVF